MSNRVSRTADGPSYSARHARRAPDISGQDWISFFTGPPQSAGAEIFHSAAVGGGFTPGVAICQRLEAIAMAATRILTIRRRLPRDFKATSIAPDRTPDARAKEQS